MRDEIVGGLRNALDRGESLEQAMQSFINAGYSPLEVREAVKVLPASATSLIQSAFQEKSFSSPQPSSNASTSSPSVASSSSSPSQPLPQNGAAKSTPAQDPKANTKLIIGLSIVLILLIIAGVGSYIWLQNKGPAI